VRGDESVLRDLTTRMGGMKGVLMALPSFLTLDIDES